MLLISENAHVMLELEWVSGLAGLAEVWFDNSCLFNLNSHDALALLALEECFLHLRNNIWVADDNALDGNKCLDVAGIEVSDPVDFSEIVRPDLNDNILVFFLLFLLLGSLLNCLVCNRSDHIEEGDQVGGVPFELRVEFLIVLVDVITIYIEDSLLSDGHLFEFSHVKRSPWEILIFLFSCYIEVLEECSKPSFNVVLVDIGSPNDFTSLGGWLAVHLSLKRCRNGELGGKLRVENSPLSTQELSLPEIRGLLATKGTTKLSLKETTSERVARS